MCLGLQEKFQFTTNFPDNIAQVHGVPQSEKSWGSMILGNNFIGGAQPIIS